MAFHFLSHITNAFYIICENGNTKLYLFSLKCCMTSLPEFNQVLLVYLQVATHTHVAV